MVLTQGVSCGYSQDVGRGCRKKVLLEPEELLPRWHTHETFDREPQLLEFC